MKQLVSTVIAGFDSRMQKTILRYRDDVRCPVCGGRYEAIEGRLYSHVDLVRARRPELLF